MNDILVWLEQHPGLAGYVQAVGSLIALGAALLMPVWQRHSLEHAAGLQLGGLIEQCFEALLGVQREFFPDYCRDPHAIDCPTERRAAPDPAKAVRQMARAIEQLERVSLFELKPQCRKLVHDLKGEMSLASAHAMAYADGAVEAQGFDEDTLEGYERSAYSLMLSIMKFAPGAGDKRKFAPGVGDKWLIVKVEHELTLIDQEQAGRSRALREAGIVRIRIRRTLRSRLEKAWRWLRAGLGGGRPAPSA
jgi:hypothetical protein